ncbi:hypothetical protein CEXT_410141, partial [Caerostris extrusa]
LRGLAHSTKGFQTQKLRYQNRQMIRIENLSPAKPSSSRVTLTHSEPWHDRSLKEGSAEHGIQMPQQRAEYSPRMWL